MTRPVTVIERVGDWKQAFDAIREELTPPATRDILAIMMTTVSPEGPIASANVAMALARLVAGNDRAAATVAAMLTATGIKPLALNYEDDA